MTRAPRQAFTLVEVIVVVSMLAIIAGFITPRLMRRSDAPAQDTVEMVRVFLSSVAARDAATSAPIAIEYNADAHTLGLLIENDNPEIRSFWKRDTITPRVDLGAVNLTAAIADGGLLGRDGWRFELAQAERRARLEFELESRSSGRRWVVSLEPMAMRAASSTSNEVPTSVDVIDLDDTARGNWVW
ncbi:MAG: type II secretion system protein [Phycisphaeraceae bacterium]|nr:type II secretion system protein [Phycisphaerales bacterium]MCB9861413.1 type II secretion system protein [Phycisphaeraceae bacterium]